MKAERIVNVLLEASTSHDFEHVAAIKRGEVPRYAYKDGWEYVNSSIADQVGVDFGVDCEGSYQGPDKAYVYSQNGDPSILVLVRGKKIVYVVGLHNQRVSKSLLPAVRELMSQLGLEWEFGKPSRYQFV